MIECGKLPAVHTEAGLPALAKSRTPSLLAREAYVLYEPPVTAGVRGWGAAGTLDLDAIRTLAARRRAGRSWSAAVRFQILEGEPGRVSCGDDQVASRD